MGGAGRCHRLRLENPEGLHARPAAALARLARGYRGALLLVRKGEATANAASVLELMTLNANRGDEIELRASGPAGDALLEAAVRLVEQGFGLRTGGDG